jgi:aspartate ammonia-lyase
MSVHTTDDFRTERDSLGSIRVPAGALWGAHTQRALANFTISGIPVGQHRELVRALGLVKKAAAVTNADLALIPADVGRAIAQACDIVIRGDADDAFPVDVVQGGAGTSTNMNANEVIANLALDVLGLPHGSYDRIHPIEHVNKCQSTNDVYPTAVRLALQFATDGLLERLGHLSDAFAERGRAFASTTKVGRTQLQDAVPMTLGQEFTAFAVTLREDQQRLREAMALLRECNLGATAIGTGITADARYRERVVAVLAGLSGVEMTPAEDMFEATWDTGAFLLFSGILKRTAMKLAKICNDLRLLSSGPQTGLGEIRLPALQAGSSIMPGKVNPVIPEMVNQIAFYVAGTDLTVTMAAENGQLQLNAFEPTIAHALLTAVDWLGKGCTALDRLCVCGIEANEDVLRLRAGAASGWLTALVPLVGYAAAARLAHEATAGRDVLDLAVGDGLIDRQQADVLRAGSTGETTAIPSEGTSVR